MLGEGVWTVSNKEDTSSVLPIIKALFMYVLSDFPVVVVLSV